MADTKISALTALTSPDDDDEMVIVDDSASTTKKITWANVVTAIGDPDEATKPLTTQSGTTYTLDSDDHNTIIVFTNASQVTVTVPTDASDDLIDGFRVTLFAAGAGGLTLSYTGITFYGSSPNDTIDQNEAVYLEKSSTANTWVVIGATS